MIVGVDLAEEGLMDSPHDQREREGAIPGNPRQKSVRFQTHFQQSDRRRGATLRDVRNPEAREDHAKANVLVIGRRHYPAHLVGGIPERGFQGLLGGFLTAAFFRAGMGTRSVESLPILTVSALPPRTRQSTPSPFGFCPVIRKSVPEVESDRSPQRSICPRELEN